MATTRAGTSTTGSTNPMAAGDVDARYRTGADYWTDRDGGPGPQVMAADTLEGDTVKNDAGEELGEITDIMIDVPTGRVAAGGVYEAFQLSVRTVVFGSSPVPRRVNVMVLPALLIFQEVANSGSSSWLWRFRRTSTPPVR